jgi:hypothetical protein
MQAASSFTIGHLILAILASGLVTGLGAILINRLGDWWSGKTRSEVSKSNAEVTELRASTIKIQAEADTAYAESLWEASKRITELVEINSVIQGKLDEAERERDNSQWNLRQKETELKQSEIRQELQEHFLKQLEAANELGVRLKDLSPDQIAEINKKKSA